jgi:anthranilate synthase
MTTEQDINEFTTKGGIKIRRETEPEIYEGARMLLVDSLDSHRGVLLSSDFEYPGRYTRWDMGFIDPPVEISAIGRAARVRALSDRGRILVNALAKRLPDLHFLESYSQSDNEFTAQIAESTERFPEEERSKQPSIFSLVREILDFLKAPEEEAFFGLYGSFGYNLAFQFEPLDRKQNLDGDQRDLLLYLPDRLLLVDHQRGEALWYHYEFEIDGESTTGIARSGPVEAFKFADPAPIQRDHAPGEYGKTVSKAKEYFKAGDLFETVPGVNTLQPVEEPPSVIFRRLMQVNPAPYGFFMNIGEQEYLVGASPEMFVRVEGRQVETCPISGTIRRGTDPIHDASQILTLLNSKKDESELTMCTDVDRNDKSRICEPGSVKVIGRRQIEMYSRLIHTVDHVIGTLRSEFDALDAFLSHAWAVTVTGAPKKWAMQFIEDHERSPRRWYGGAVGAAFANGNMNTGLTLRTIQFKDGIASVRAGATLLYDSDPNEEEDEIHVKASAFLDAISKPAPAGLNAQTPMQVQTGVGKRILLIDHEDSFVHTLANYFRQTGALVETMRFGFDLARLDEIAPDLVVFSPGPGEPSDFGMNETIGACLERNLPIFGVCLGLQGIAEYFGADLKVLDYPMHGKPSTVTVEDSPMFTGLPNDFTTARYHSIYIAADQAPTGIQVLGKTEDGVAMAIGHESLPVWAVQFHPESILTLENDHGLQVIRNVVGMAVTAA